DGVGQPRGRLRQLEARRPEFEEPADRGRQARVGGVQIDVVHAVQDGGARAVGRPDGGQSHGVPPSRTSGRGRGGSTGSPTRGIVNGGRDGNEPGERADGSTAAEKPLPEGEACPISEYRRTPRRPSYPGRERFPDSSMVE